jgi:shikimate 5-dehydrogenase
VELEVGWVEDGGRHIAAVKPDILVNATPAGTLGEHEGDSVVDAEQLPGIKLVYDLTYNPRETRMIRDARAAGCRTLDGLEMLIAQAAMQFELWTGGAPEKAVMLEAATKRLSI